MSLRAIGAGGSVLAVALLASCAPLHLDPGGGATRRLVVNGAELHYVEQGRGDLVVFLHGTATDYRIFDELRRHIGPGFRFVAYSRRHHAPNAWPDAGTSYTLDQHVDDLVAFVRALGDERAHVVAVSMGARVAAHAAVRHPEILRTLTLSDGLLAPPATDEGQRAMQELGKQFETMFAHINAGDADAAVATYVDVATSGRGWQGMPAMWQGYYRDNARTIVLAAADRTLRPPTCAALRAIPVPILLIAGERTPPAIRATNDGLMDCLRPDAERARVPDAGHYWYADNAAEGARLLVAFLRRHRGQ